MARRVVDQLVTELTADGAKMRTEMSRSIDDTRAWGRRVGGIVAGAVGAIATTAFIDKVIEATKTQEAALTQLQQTLISTNNAVGVSFDELVASAAAFQAQTTFGDEEIISAQSKLATFTNITGDAFNRATAAALDLSTKMDQDLKSSIVQIGKALNDPVAGISALSRTGIQFTQDQKDLIKSLAETGQTAAAQTIILKELETQFGGSAKAARDNLGGALASLKNTAGDLLEADGLGGAKEGIEELNEVLADPATVAAAQALTGGIITAFTGATKAISGTVNLVRFLAEELAAFTTGPALGDTVRIQDALTDINEQITALDSRASIGRGQSNFVVAKREELEQEKQRLQELLALSNELSQSPAKPTPSIANAPTASGGTPSANGAPKVKGGTGVDEQNAINAAILKAEQEHQAKLAKIKAQAAAQDQKMLEDARGLYGQIQQERLREEDNVLDLEALRYQRQRAALEKELELLRERGLLTAQIEAEHREAQANAEAIHQKRLTDIQNSEQAERNAFMQQGYNALLDVVDRYYDGQQGSQAAFTRAAISLTRVLLDEEQRAAVKKIAMHTHSAAMGAYSSLAPIPLIGPALGVAAATGIYVAGAAAGTAVLGLAHDGMDAIPQTGTWLLEKGERVTTEKTSAKLDNTLSDVQSMLGNAGGSQGQNSPAQNNIKIINVPANDSVENYLNTEAGEQLIMNIVGKYA